MCSSQSFRMSSWSAIAFSLFPRDSGDFAAHETMMKRQTAETRTTTNHFLNGSDAFIFLPPTSVMYASTHRGRDRCGRRLWSPWEEHPLCQYRNSLRIHLH